MPLEVLTNYKSAKSWNGSAPREGARCPARHGVRQRGAARPALRRGGGVSAAHVPGGAVGGRGRPAWRGRPASRLASVGSRVAHQSQYSWWRREVPLWVPAPRFPGKQRRRHSAGRAPWPPADRSARCLAPPLAPGPRGPAKQRRGEGRRVTAWWRRRSRFSRSESSRHVADRSHYMKPLYRNLAPVGRNYKRCNEMTSDG